MLRDQGVPRGDPVGGGRHIRGVLEREIAGDKLHELVVAAMAVEDEDAFEPGGDQGFTEIAHQAVIGFGADRHRAAEGEVMARRAERQGRRDDNRDAGSYSRCRSASDVLDRESVGAGGHVWAVLLGCPGWQQGDRMRGDLVRLGAGHFVQEFGYAH